MVVRLLTVSVVFWPTKMGLVLNVHVVPGEQAREMAPLKLEGPLRLDDEGCLGGANQRGVYVRGG